MISKVDVRDLCPVCGKPPEERPLTSEEFVDSHLFDGCLIECKGHLSSGYAANRALARDYWRFAVTTYKPTEKAQALAVTLHGEEYEERQRVLWGDSANLRLRAELKEAVCVLEYEVMGALSRQECCDTDLPVLQILYHCPYRCEKPGKIPGNTIHGCYELVAFGCCACLCGESEEP